MRNSAQRSKYDIHDFGRHEKSSTCHYLTGDEPFNGTSQRIYKRTVAASFGRSRRFRLMRLNLGEEFAGKQKHREGLKHNLQTVT